MRGFTVKIAGVARVGGRKQDPFWPGKIKQSAVTQENKIANQGSSGGTPQ